MKVSVAFCTYNGEKHLAEQLDSILGQSIHVDEIIICDDGSTDNTLIIIQEYGNKYPEVFKIFSNEKNIGYTKNFEKAIGICTGDLIFLCDQDDIWKLNKVEVVKQTAELNPQKNVFAHRIEILESNGKTINQSFWDIDHFNLQWNNSDILQLLLFKRNIFPGMSIALTKDAQQKYLPFINPDKKTIHDFEIILKACRDNSFKAIDESLALYRLHDDQNIGFDINFKVPSTHTAQTMYNEIKRIDFVNKNVLAFQLNPALVELYKDKCKKEYGKFISGIRFPHKCIAHLKMKYYYKALNEIK